MLAAALMLAAVAARASGSEPEKYGLESVGASLSTTQAGAHPDFSTFLELATDPATPADGDGDHKPYAPSRDIRVSLPPGLIGNPTAVATCSSLQFATALLNEFAGEPGCPTASQVGLVSFKLYELSLPVTEPIYNLESPGGEYVGRLGFWGYNVPIFINVRARSGDDYGLTAELNAISSTFPLVSATTILWAVPADSSHDTQRLTPAEAVSKPGQTESPPRGSGLAPRPFMTNPTRCGVPQEVGFSADSYAEPTRIDAESAALPEITDCGLVPFEPTMSLQPTSRFADSPSGMNVELSIPQPGLELVNLNASAHLRTTVVTLPPGLTISPAAADGLSGCSEQQVGLINASPIRFDPVDANCPDSSKVGSATIVTPLLPDPLEGSLYVARQDENPFDTLLAGYLVARGKGVIVKLAGRFGLNPDNGQITALFDENPQQPFSDLRLHFKGGARGVLVTPPACATYQIHHELTPWSGTPPVSGDSPFTVDEGCGTGGFTPSLDAGTTNPVAGAHSPFAANVRREDGDQNLARIDVALPPGELANLAGVPLCTDGQATAADCPAGAQVGTAKVAVGAGSLPLWIPQSGKAPTAVYLAGPYKGAPYSLVVEVPAQAGPFDLGTVVTRAGIYIDEETARATVRSDPLPQILEGVPIRYRTVHVDVDRPGFALNPTNCEAMSVDAAIVSDQGAIATPKSRFQIGSCGDLRFKPRLALKLRGKTTRGGHPALTGTLRMPERGANIRRAVVALPGSEFLDQGHINTVCTRVQFAAEECPAGAVYGRARAITPLLDEPLEGPVYLRSSNHELPDLAADLRGQIHVVVVGRIDSVNGGIRTTFESVPDAPVSKFTLKMKGGAKGLLVNSTNLCRQTNRATAKFTGQNGKVRNFRPVLRDGCGR
jgi:hypothetical protein